MHFNLEKLQQIIQTLFFARNERKMFNHHRHCTFGVQLVRKLVEFRLSEGHLKKMV